MTTPPFRVRRGALAFALALGLSGACGSDDADDGEAELQVPRTPPLSEVPEPALEPQTDSDLWSDVERLYELARQSGAEVPSNVYDWMKQDIESYGTWEYRVLWLGDRPSTALADVERELNALGRERWECFWVDVSLGGPRYYFKRPVRSYVSAIPLPTLLELLPHAGEGDK